jgi:hypothetical protein
MIARSKRIHVESFPSIRFAMLQMIRTATNPRAMKKLAYIVALLLAIVGYRGFLRPVGACCGATCRA